jgi:peptidoglycan/LPS O-acetylase OafA/YrhL
MKKHILSLNGLRTISILMVIGAHLLHHHYFTDSNNKALKYFGFIFFNGQLGVNIFFVISGFLITTLLIYEKENTGDISLKNFYARRSIRIFPAYYFLLLVYFILQLVGYLNFDAREWLANLTYTKQFFPSGDDVAGHLWSLSVEEVFYLIWPLLFIITGKHAVKVILLLIVFITVGRVFEYNTVSPFLTNTIFSTGDALSIGCLFAIWRERIVAWVIKTKKWNFIVFPAIILFIFAFNYLYHLTQVPNRLQNTTLLNHILLPASYALIGDMGILTNILIGIIIIISINLKNTWRGFLNLPFMEHIGKLSYSIYLWQQLFSFMHKLPLLPLLLCIYLAACFSYYVIEKPFLRLKARFNTMSAP